MCGCVDVWVSMIHPHPSAASWSWNKHTLPGLRIGGKKSTVTVNNAAALYLADIPILLTYPPPTGLGTTDPPEKNNLEKYNRGVKKGS